MSNRVTERVVGYVVGEISGAIGADSDAAAAGGDACIVVGQTVARKD